LAGWDFAMSGTEFEEQMESPAGVAEANPGCMDLVPMVQSAHWSQTVQQVSRPDPCFVTQLIATAEQAPQTRNLRRATVADAQAAYRFVTDHNHITLTGMRTRQTS
jgi:hypothetical protein